MKIKKQILPLIIGFSIGQLLLVPFHMADLTLFIGMTLGAITASISMPSPNNRASATPEKNV